MKTKTQLIKDIKQVLTKLSNGKTVNGVSVDYPITIPNSLKLLGTSVKTEKGRKRGIQTSILYLAPNISGQVRIKNKKLNVCPYATKACISACLGTETGHLRYKSATNSKAWKTALLFASPKLFKELLILEIKAKQSAAEKNNLICAVRLNGTSDLDIFHNKWKMHLIFPNVYFYDYTKSSRKIKDYQYSKNYHLTYSASSRKESKDIANLALDKGLSVACIVDNEPRTDQQKIDMACQVLGRYRYFINIEDFDETDARFLTQHQPTIGYLKIKGGAKNAKRMDNDIIPVYV